MSKGLEFNDWCIIAGQDFREIFFLEDLTADQIDNPDYDPELPERDNNPRLVFPPKDLTGWTGKMDIREKDNFSSPLIISRATGGGGMTIGQPDPADGSVEIFIDNSVTKTDAQILANIGNNAHFDLYLFPPDFPTGDAERIFWGVIPILSAITDIP